MSNSYFFLASRYHVEIDDNESKLCQRLQSFHAKLNVSVNSNKLIWISTWMRCVLRVFVVSLPTYHLLQWLSMKYYKIEFVENPKKGWRYWRSMVHLYNSKTLTTVHCLTTLPKSLQTSSQPFYSHQTSL